MDLSLYGIPHISSAEASCEGMLDCPRSPHPASRQCSFRLLSVPTLVRVVLYRPMYCRM